jgi:hypothetical protein
MALALTSGMAVAAVINVQPVAVRTQPPPSSVMPNVPTAPDIVAFDELQNVVLDRDIVLDAHPILTSVHGTREPITVKAGTCASSHYMVYLTDVPANVTPAPARPAGNPERAGCIPGGRVVS